MTVYDFVKTAKPGFYRNINTTAHSLNDALKQQGLYDKIKLLEKITIWTRNPDLVR